MKQSWSLFDCSESPSCQRTRKGVNKKEIPQTSPYNPVLVWLLARDLSPILEPSDRPGSYLPRLALPNKPELECISRPISRPLQVTPSPPPSRPQHPFPQSSNASSLIHQPQHTNPKPTPPPSQPNHQITSPPLTAHHLSNPQNTLLTRPPRWAAPNLRTHATRMCPIPARAMTLGCTRHGVTNKT